MVNTMADLRSAMMTQNRIFTYISTKQKGVVIIQVFLLLIGLLLMSIFYNKLDHWYGTTAFSIGTTFSAGAIVSFIDLVRNTLELLADSNITQILDCGITGVYDHRDIEEYYELVKKSKKIDICGYSLRGFMQSHKNTILKLAKHKDFKMRIVLVNPDSYISINRAVLEGEVEGEYKGQCKNVIETFQDHPNIEVYYVDFALSTMIFRIDDVMYIGPHFVKSASKSSFTMKLEKDKWGYSEFQSEFEEMCKKGNKQAVTSDKIEWSKVLE